MKFTAALRRNQENEKFYHEAHEEHEAKNFLKFDILSFI
jgi:hypothetical protein